MALRLNTSEKNEIMPRRKARAEKPRLAQMLLRSGSLAGVESTPEIQFDFKTWGYFEARGRNYQWRYATVNATGCCDVAFRKNLIDNKR